MNVKNDCSSLLLKCPNILSILNCGLFQEQCLQLGGGIAVYAAMSGFMYN